MLAYFCYPETSKQCPLVKPWCVANLAFLEGLSVDEAFTLFDDGLGVNKSKKMRREKIEMQNTYNAEGFRTGLTEVVEKSEASHKENMDSAKPIGIESSE